MAQVEAMVDGKLEERVARLERLVEALLNRPLRVEVVVPERSMGGCEREALLRLLARLEVELAKDLEGCPLECKRKAIARLELYELELKELLREEPVFGGR